MRHVQVVGSVSPATLEIRMGRLASIRPSSRTDGDAHPDPFDLILAGLGGSTANCVIAHAVSNGWDLDAVYVELALHGEVPWQAIGRRIWVDGNLDEQQLAALLLIAEQSPVTGTMNSVVHVQSRIDRLPDQDGIASFFPQLAGNGERT
ncbi:MAG: osmotically inducible protein [Devosia sp.]|uniref:OsmC family protein n=1 Tax=Devosia sp. TaxID=1871048 RepID=UPI002633A922|nr:hypothetical protein [Devosia sp.]MDB5542360.1 osmotically inducible protein [Devosia sp.]